MEIKENNVIYIFYIYKENIEFRIRLARDDYDLFPEVHTREYTVWPVVVIV